VISTLCARWLLCTWVGRSVCVIILFFSISSQILLLEECKPESQENWSVNQWCLSQPNMLICFFLFLFLFFFFTGFSFILENVWILCLM
jgi:hypothetical protein